MRLPGKTIHPRLLRLLNTTGRLFNNGSSLVRLEEEKLLSRACARTGLSDFGDAAFREALRVLLQSLEEEARLSFIGRICVYHDLLRLLSNRLQVVEDRKRYPEITQVALTPPLFITGLPRSGTTFLHALLAQDPAHRSPRVWEVMRPSPPPALESYDSDPRIALVEKELKYIDVLMPEFQTVHLIDARLPQECIAITNHDFRSYTFESMYSVPTYRAWHDRLDKRPVYEFHRRFLQHLQWRCPGERWVLKAPSHLLALPALLAVYPDARIILTHRDPLKVLASCGSFTEVLRGGFSDRIDKIALGQEVRQRWEEGAHLAVDCHRQSLPLRKGFLDVNYPDLVHHPMAVVRRIYAHFEMKLTSGVEAAMARFLAENPKGKGGEHRYSLEEFGLNAEEERRRFQFYMDFFGLEPEKL